MQSSRYTCHILKKDEFSGRIFKKVLECEISLTSVRGRTDGHDEANSRFFLASRMHLINEKSCYQELYRS